MVDQCFKVCSIPFSYIFFISPSPGDRGHDATGLLRHRGLAGSAKDWAAHASRSPAPRLREAAAYVHQEILQRPLREHSTLVVTESRRLAPVIPDEACSVPALAPSLALAPPLALAAMVRTTIRHRICSHSNSSLRRFLRAGGPFEYALQSARGPPSNGTE